MEANIGLFLSQRGFSLTEQIDHSLTRALYSATRLDTSATVSVRLISNLSANLFIQINRHYEEIRQLDTLPAVRKLIANFGYCEGDIWTIIVVMDWTEGNLEQEIEKRRVSGQHWSEGELMKVASDLCVSLAAMQERRVSGRPISIRDVFYRAENRVTLSDFQEQTMDENSEVGSENRRQFTESDIKEDVLCLGVVLSHCVRLDCESFLPSEGDRQRYPQLLPIISSMLAADPANRPDFVSLCSTFFPVKTTKVRKSIQIHPTYNQIPSMHTSPTASQIVLAGSFQAQTIVPEMDKHRGVEQSSALDITASIECSEPVIPIVIPISVVVPSSVGSRELPSGLPMSEGVQLTCLGYLAVCTESALRCCSTAVLGCCEAFASCCGEILKILDLND